MLFKVYKMGAPMVRQQLTRQLSATSSAMAQGKNR